jgi:hypothetical protein
MQRLINLILSANPGRGRAPPHGGTPPHPAGARLLPRRFTSTTYMTLSRRKQRHRPESRLLPAKENGRGGSGHYTRCSRR